MADFLVFRNGHVDINQMMPNQQNQVVANTLRLSQRVEELEDLVHELKTKQSVGEMIELKLLNSQLEIEQNNQNKKLAVLQEQRLNSKDLFVANDMHQSFLKIMKERELIIEQLQNQVKKFGD